MGKEDVKKVVSLREGSGVESGDFTEEDGVRRGSRLRSKGG